MTLVFGWEKFRHLLDEPNLGDLLNAHYEELAVHKDQMPLDPDYQRFVQLEEMGLFRVWAGREKSSNTFSAYMGWFIQPHLHYKSTLTAVEDLFMLAPPYRKGMNGVRMFTTAFDALRELGVKRIICHTKCHHQAERGGLDKLFARLGFEQTDKIWSRML